MNIIAGSIPAAPPNKMATLAVVILFGGGRWDEKPAVGFD